MTIVRPFRWRILLFTILFPCSLFGRQAVPLPSPAETPPAVIGSAGLPVADAPKGQPSKPLVTLLYQKGAESEDALLKAFSRLTNYYELATNSYSNAAEPEQSALPKRAGIIIGPQRTSAINYLARQAETSTNGEVLRHSIFLAPMVTGNPEIYSKHLSVLQTSVNDQQTLGLVNDFLKHRHLRLSALIYTDDEWGQGWMKQLSGRQDSPLRLLPVAAATESDMGEDPQTGLQNSINAWIRDLARDNVGLVLLAVQRNSTINQVLRAIAVASRAQIYGYRPTILVLREPIFGDVAATTVSKVNIPLVRSAYDRTSVRVWPRSRRLGNYPFFFLSCLSTNHIHTDLVERTYIEPVHDVVTVLNALAQDTNDDRTSLTNNIAKFYRGEYRNFTTPVLTSFHERRLGNIISQNVIAHLHDDFPAEHDHSGTNGAEGLGERIKSFFGGGKPKPASIACATVWDETEELGSIALLFEYNPVLSSVWTVSLLLLVAFWAVAFQVSERAIIPIRIIWMSRPFWIVQILNMILVYCAWCAAVYFGTIPSVHWGGLWAAAMIAFVGTHSLGAFLDILRRLPAGHVLVDVFVRWHELLLDHVTDEEINELTKESTKAADTAARIRDLERRIGELLEFRIRNSARRAQFSRRVGEISTSHDTRPDADAYKAGKLLELYLKILRYIHPETKEFLKEVGPTELVTERGLKGFRESSSRRARLLGRLRIWRLKTDEAKAASLQPPAASSNSV